MAVRTTIKSLMRLSRRRLNRIKPLAIMGTVGGFGGAAAGFSGGQAGHRTDSAREGAISGALSTIGTMVVFRRVRGRIIPIKVRKT